MKLNGYIQTIRAFLRFNNTVEELRGGLFDLASRMIVDQAAADAAPKVGQRFIIRLHRSTVHALGTDHTSEELYFIEGRITHSKVFAVKKVRELDGLGIAEAHSLVVSLPVINVEGNIS